MLKCVYCVRRLASVSEQDFYDYWLNQHGPLVRKHAPTLGMRRYVQSHTIQNPQLNAAAQQPRGINEMYDGVTEVWWDSVEALMGALQTEEAQEANRILSADEATFVDCENSAIFFSTEHTIFDFPTNS
jgi:uncharacterized protein (TIGR02118 family)